MMVIQMIVQFRLPPVKQKKWYDNASAAEKKDFQKAKAPQKNDSHDHDKNAKN